MARECGDCYWAKITYEMGSTTWRCSKKFNKKIEFDDYACSEYQSSDANTCEFCEYYEGGKYKWSTSGICTLKGTKRHDSDVACSRYYEA